MRLMRCLPLALPCLLACGGSSPKGDAPTAPVVKPMSADDARAATWGFLTVEHSAAVASRMPGFIRSGDGQLLSLPALPTCVGVTTTLAGGTTTVALSFTACAGPDGGTLNGGVTLAFNAQATEFSVTYQNLVAHKDSRTWTFNGSKNLKLDAAAKHATLQATHLSAVFSDSAHPDTNKNYLYDTALTADWAATGTYKLWGSFSLSDNGTLTSGTIANTAPLTWAEGCCYPVSGTIAFARGGAATTAAFGLPCGTLTLAPAGQPSQTQVLAACAP